MFVIICIDDLKVLYCCWMLKMFFDYCELGLWMEQIFCENIFDFDLICLCQCVVVDMLNWIMVLQMIGCDVVMFVVFVFVGLIGM